MNNLAKFEYKVNPEITSPKCRLCSGPDEENDEDESSVHLTFHCPKLLLLRVECFGQYVMEPPYLWTVKGLKRFLQNKYVMSLDGGLEREGPQCWEELKHLQLRVIDGNLELVDEREGIG